MATIVGSYTKANIAAPTVATILLKIGPNQDGDLIVICWRRQASNTTPPTCPTFTSAVASNNGHEASGILYHVNSGGTTDEEVTVTGPSVTNMCCDSYVIRGVHSSPIGATGTSNNGGSSTATLAAASLTTTANNSLVIHSCGVRSAFAPWSTGSTFMVIQNSNSGSATDAECAGLSGIDYVATAGASPSFDFKLPASAAIVDCAMEIKTDGTSIPVVLTSGRTVIDHNAYTDATNTWYLPNDGTIGISSISGVSMGSYDGTNVLTGKMQGSSFARRQIAYNTQTATWEGKFETVGAGTIDLTGKVLCIPWARLRASNDRIGPNGVICVLVDSAYNWVAYTLRNAEDEFVSSDSGMYTKFIKHGVTTALDSGGPTTFDISIIKYIGYFAQGLMASSDVTSYIYLGPVWMEDSPTIFTGGGATAPINVDVINRYVYASGLWGSISQIQGTKQYLGWIKHQVGDGTRKTYLETAGQSFAFRNTDIDYRVGAGDCGLTLKGSSTCTFDMSASIVEGEVQQGFTIDSAGSASATFLMTGASFINLDWACDIAVPYSGASFSACLGVELGGNTITNATVTTPTGTSAATVNLNNATLDGCSLSVARLGTDAAYHLSLGASVTAITLNGVTLSGTAVTDKIYSALASGTLTITTDGTGTALVAGDVTFVGGSTAVAVIAAPQVYQSVVISGFTAGSRIYLYDTGTADELLFNGTASSGETVISGTTCTWTDSTAASANRTIFIRVAYVDGVTAKEFIEVANIGTCGTTEATKTVSYIATQSADATYNANGENGSTIYGAGEITFTDAGTDIINMNMAAGTISLQKQYAAWVYYAFTSAGIATDIDYIRAIDTANYEYTGMVWKNTSSPTAPLKVTGGYAWDSSTLDPMDLIDTTGGTIFLAPAHVVATIVTVGGVNIITGDIADVPTAAEIAAEVTGDPKTLTVPKFMGLK